MKRSRFTETQIVKATEHEKAGMPKKSVVSLVLLVWFYKTTVSF
jgi:hypothetical protein